MLPGGGGEMESSANTLEHSVLNKDCPQEKLTRAQPAAVLLEPNLHEGTEIPNSSPL